MMLWPRAPADVEPTVGGLASALLDAVPTTTILSKPGSSVIEEVTWASADELPPSPALDEDTIRSAGKKSPVSFRSESDGCNGALADETASVWRLESVISARIASGWKSSPLAIATSVTLAPLEVVLRIEVLQFCERKPFAFSARRGSGAGLETPNRLDAVASLSRKQSRVDTLYGKDKWRRAHRDCHSQFLTNSRKKREDNAIFLPPAPTLGCKPPPDQPRWFRSRRARWRCRRRFQGCGRGRTPYLR